MRGVRTRYPCIKARPGNKEPMHDGMTETKVAWV